MSEEREKQVEEAMRVIKDAQYSMAGAAINCKMLLDETTGFFNRLKVKYLIGKIEGAEQLYVNALNASSKSERLKELNLCTNLLVESMKSCTENASKYSHSEAARKLVDLMMSNLVSAGKVVQWLIKDLKKG